MPARPRWSIGYFAREECAPRSCDFRFSPPCQCYARARACVCVCVTNSTKQPTIFSTEISMANTGSIILFVLGTTRGNESAYHPAEIVGIQRDRCFSRCFFGSLGSSVDIGPVWNLFLTMYRGLRIEWKISTTESMKSLCIEELWRICEKSLKFAADARAVKIWSVYVTFRTKSSSPFFFFFFLL